MESREKWNTIKCPECGHDAFVVGRSWIGHMRFFQYGKAFLFRSEKISEQGEATHHVFCEKCKHGFCPPETETDNVR